MGIQVEELTRNLMPWGKEYIDFSFAGRHISEFGLVAVTSGDRYQFAGSPEFEDETSKINGVWGQYYWGTNYKTKTYSYSLATDGMTERQFEEFKYHFRPGHYGQFYEDAWFDRYCYVRLKAVVDFNFIPFQEEVEVAGVKFPSRVYKGECKISFIQDKPFMHSFYQILDSKIKDLTSETNNGKAALRMIYNSNIPAKDSWTKSIKCCTGSWLNLQAKQDEQTNSKINNNNLDDSVVYTEIDNIPYYNPSTTQSKASIEFILERKTSEVNTENWEPIFFNEIYDEFTNASFPYNTIMSTDKILVSEGDIPEEPYYTHKYKYGLPEISSEINKAINIAWNFYQENPRGALIELQERFQEELINNYVLVWIVKILQKIQMNQALYRAVQSEDGLGWGFLIDAQENGIKKASIDLLDQDKEENIGTIIFHSGDYEEESYYENNDIEGCFRTNKITVYAKPIYNSPLQVDWFGYFNIMMLMMFGECNNYEDNDITTEDVFTGFYPYTLIFNGEEGQSFVSYKINTLNIDNIIIHDYVSNENCSNIIASEYLKVEGGDTIEISTGLINSYHLLGFKHGEDENLIVKEAKLKYKYTYV